MNMVFDTADAQRRRTLVISNAFQVGMKAFTKRAILQEGLAVLGRKDNVNVDLNERLGHGLDFLPHNIKSDTAKRLHSKAQGRRAAAHPG